MKILIVGGGGREHALGWALAGEGREIFFAPGNGGTGNNIPITPAEIDKLAEFSQREKIDLTVVGPEAPLAEGVVDEFEKRGLKIFGPSKNASEIEASKAFAREFMKKYGIPSPHFEIVTSFEEGKKMIENWKEERMVVKASGLAAGKGSYVCMSKKEALKALEEIMVERRFGSSGDTVVIEEYLEGEEASILAISSGEQFLTLLPSQDHKRAYDGDRGPNTGGMGAYAPCPLIKREDVWWIEEHIMRPALSGLVQEGREFRGVLYAGLMVTDKGPMVLEFNVRFGDPETQAILPLLKTDLLSLIEGAIEGKLSERIEWEEGYAVCVVLASSGYPGKYEKGKEIKIEEWDGIIFHAGTKREGEKLLTSGGRVLNVVGKGKTLKEAKEKAYEGVRHIHFDGMFYRKDIGDKGLRYG